MNYVKLLEGSVTIAKQNKLIETLQHENSVLRDQLSIAQARLRIADAKRSEFDISADAQLLY